MDLKQQILLILQRIADDGPVVKSKGLILSIGHKINTWRKSNYMIILDIIVFFCYSKRI